jgi:hypothetical protein
VEGPLEAATKCLLEAEHEQPSAALGNDLSAARISCGVVLCWCNVIVVALLSRIWVGPNDGFRNSQKLRASRGDSEMTARH